MSSFLLCTIKSADTKHNTKPNELCQSVRNKTERRQKSTIYCEVIGFCEEKRYVRDV